MAEERIRLIVDGDAAGAVRAANQAKRAVGDLTSQTRTSSRASNAFAAAQREQARTLNQMGHAAKRAAQGLTALAVGGLAHAIRTGADFEQQMARVDAVTGANAKQMKRLTDVALELGAKTKYSAGQAAGAMYEMAAAGFKVNETTSALPGVLALAASSNIELKDAAEISSNALRGFKLQASQSGHVADVMASAVNKSSLELVDLQYSMKYIGPIAATTGQSLEQMTAALSLMGNAGIKGEQAGTTLRGALVRLTKPTKMVNEGLRTLNLDIKDLQGPKGLKPLSEIVKLVEQRTEGMGKATRNTALAQIFGTEALSGMVAVVDSGSGKLNALTKAYENSDGAAIKSANTMNSTVAGAFENLKGSVETVETRLFLKFRKPLREALLEAAGLVNTKGKEIERFFDRVTGTQEFKAADLKGQIQILIREIGEAMNTGELSEDVGRALGTALEKALPVVAEAAGKAGVLAAKAFATAFIESSPLGRLVLATWLLKKTGGLAAFAAMGRQSGGSFAGGFATTAAGGTKGGGFKSALIAGGKQAGLAAAIAAGIAFGPEWVKEIKKSLSGKTQKFDLPKDPTLFNTGLGRSALGPFAGKLDGILMGTSKLGQFGASAEKAAQKLQKLGDTRGLANLADQARRMAQETGKAQPAFQRFAISIEDSLLRQVVPAFNMTRSSSGKNLRAISQAVADSTFEIKQRLGDDTTAGRMALAQNFNLAAAAIRKSMKDGVISTRTGTREIQELMVQALAQYGFSRKEALNIAKGKEFSGKSAPGGGSQTNAAHGYIGNPGAAGRDTVPLMVGEGEAVLNRHQQQVVDGALAAQGIGGLPELFSKVQTPHYMAKGGIVGLGKRLQGMGYQVGEHPAFGGVAGVHARGSRHYSGNALDINADGRPGGEARWLDRLAGILRGEGWNVLWRVKDHFDHIHVDNGKGGGGGGGGAVAQLKRVLFPKGMGSLSKLGQAGLDTVRGAAQSRLDSLGVGDMGATGLGDLPGGTSGGNQALGRRMMLAAGFAANQWPALKALWQGESGWSNTARNKSSGAFGIPQALPPSKMPMAAQRGDAASQIGWGLSYIKGRYGSPSAAYRFWQSQSPHWYARGGFVGAAKGKPGKGPRLNAKIVSRTPHFRVTKGRRFKHHLPLKTLASLDRLGGQIDDMGPSFDLMVRRHGLTDEQPLMTVPDPKTGEPTEVRDEAGIAQHVGELGEQRGLKIEIANLIAQQQGEAAKAMKLLQAGIEERKEALKALRERIRLNLQHIKEWQAAIKRKRDEIRDLRRQLADTGTKKGTAKRRAALRGQIRGLEDDITGLQTKITGAGDSNQRLSGQVNTKDGELRSWTDHNERAGQLHHDLPFDLGNVRLDIAEIDKQIGEWSGTTPPPAQIQSPDAAAGGVGGDSALTGLLQQQLDEQRRSGALARAQFGVFKNFAPLLAGRLVGSFQRGGRVPRTGLAMVHQDEMLIPDQEGPFRNSLTTSQTGSQAAPVIHLTFADNSGALVRLVDARVDGRAAQVVSQQLGRRSRLISSAAGGR